MSGIRTWIYVPDEESWESVKSSAAAGNRSVSNYLLWCHNAISGALKLAELKNGLDSDDIDHDGGGDS